MRRRQLLCGVGVVGGGVVGGVGFGTVTAESSVTEFAVSDTHFETDTSELDELWVREIHVKASWIGFDAPADVVEASLAVTYEDETVEDVSTKQIELAGDEYEGIAECQLPSVNLVSAFNSETFEVKEGETETFEFSFTLRLTVVDTSGRSLTAESTDEATATVVYSEEEIVDVLDNIVITTDGTIATIYNGGDEDVCVTLRWLHPGQDDEETHTFVGSNEEVQEEPPDGPKGASSYDIEAVGYELGECNDADPS